MVIKGVEVVGPVQLPNTIVPILIFCLIITLIGTVIGIKMNCKVLSWYDIFKVFGWAYGILLLVIGLAFSFANVQYTDAMEVRLTADVNVEEFLTTFDVLESRPESHTFIVKFKED